MAKLLHKKLEESGQQVILTREPGGIESAETIRNNIMDFNLDPKSELLLYLAARREHLIEKIIPNLKNKNIVLTDRFYLSSLVYQGYARGLGIETVRELNSFVCNGVFPDINIWLDVPVEVGLSRKEGAVDINRMDLEGIEFHKKVYEGYKLLAEQNQDKIIIIDSTLEPEQVVDMILKKISLPISR